MAILNAADRKAMPKKDFGQPEKRGFPMNDATHDRMAISGATRSFNAGNISKGEEGRIKSEAHAKLGDKGEAAQDGRGSDPKAAVAKMHPEHVHRLVQDAHAGKFGPEAQKTAQAAMTQQPAAPTDQNTDQSGATAKPNYADMFSSNQPASDEDQDDAPVDAGSMFAGSRGR